MNASVDLSVCGGSDLCGVTIELVPSGGNDSRKVTWTVDSHNITVSRSDPGGGAGEVLRQIPLDTVPLGAAAGDATEISELALLRRGTYFLLFINSHYASWATHPWNSWCSGSLSDYGPEPVTVTARAVAIGAARVASQRTAPLEGNTRRIRFQPRR